MLRSVQSPDQLLLALGKLSVAQVALKRLCLRGLRSAEKVELRERGYWLVVTQRREEVLALFELL